MGIKKEIIYIILSIFILTISIYQIEVQADEKIDEHVDLVEFNKGGNDKIVQNYEKNMFNFIPNSINNEVIPSYKGATRFSNKFEPANSDWDKDCNEQDVYLGHLKHEESKDNNWNIRIGKGGQIYSFIGPFGESIPPQRHPHLLRKGLANNSMWMDEVWQMVAVNTEINNRDIKYFIHQAGIYLRDPQFKKSFYSPELASYWDEKGKKFYCYELGTAGTCSYHL
jgi:hypothetical protein